MPTDEEIYTAYEAERQALNAYRETRDGTKLKRARWKDFIKKSNALMDMLGGQRNQLVDVFARLLEEKKKKGKGETDGSNRPGAKRHPGRAPGRS